MAVAIFNLALFLARYPEFTAVSPALLGAYFMEAGLYLDNTDCSRVTDVNRRLLLLNMLVAHIAYINGALGTDGPRPVGRVSQATEGSVSVALDNGAPAAGSAAWFQQSQYGAAYWLATANKRTMQYFPQPTRF